MKKRTHICTLALLLGIIFLIASAGTETVLAEKLVTPALSIGDSYTEDSVTSTLSTDGSYTYDSVAPVLSAGGNYCGVLNDSAEFTDNLTYRIEGNTLFIDGNGEMGDMPDRQPWKEQRDSIQKIVIGDGVTYIGACAFRYFPNLTTITIPATVKKIGHHAFHKCTNLKEAYIYAEEIGESAFIQCDNLESVHIGSQVKAIGISAFEDCPKMTAVHITDIASWCQIYFGGNMSNPLEQNFDDYEYPKANPNRLILNGQEVIDLVIPEGITEIGAFTFYCAEHLRSVHIPASVKTIDSYAFFHCERLEQVTGASSVSYIGAQAFEGTRSLSKMPFSASLSYVGPYAFRFAPLNSFSMSSGEVAQYAFDGCGSLTSISLGSDVIVGENAFHKCPGARNIQSSPVKARQSLKIGSWGNQDLEWLVLDISDGEALVISKNILQFVPYQKYENPKDAKTTWKGCSLNNWLNDTFYKSAFSASEKGNIVDSEIVDDDNPVFGTRGGESSVSRLYVLSSTELTKYFRNDEDRMASCIPAALTVAPDGHNNTNDEHFQLHTSYYWVRTPGMFDSCQSYVHYTGRILYDGIDKAGRMVGVRPVMRVNADAYGIVDQDHYIKEFVTRLYRLCLNREPDPSGFANWVDSLSSGQSTAAEVVKGFFMSKEMEQLDLPDSMFIDRCYQVMMDREADETGKASWEEILANGFSRQRIVRNFVNSIEFSQICEDYGLVKGEVPLEESRDLNYGITSYVARCYINALDRKYDVGGLNYWTGIILGAADARSKAMNTAKDGFLHSDEFLRRNLDNTEFCKVLYRLFFGREADQGGLASWVAQLEKGVDRDRVINGFAKSVEFAALLDGYGL